LILSMNHIHKIHCDVEKVTLALETHYLPKDKTMIDFVNEYDSYNSLD